MIQFIFRSLCYFRKQHLSVFAGTVLGTAVLTGAIILGDSVRYSLRSLVDKRLGKTEYILNTGGRFVRAKLAHEVSADCHIPAAPVLMLQGIAINEDNSRNGLNVRVIGIDDDFRQFSDEPMQILHPDEAIISENVAQNLKLKPGDEFILRVENIGIIPLNTPLVSTNKPTLSINLRVKNIVKGNFLSRFSLNNNQAAPFNVFILRNILSEKLKLSGLINLILFSGIHNPDDLNKSLNNHLELKDLGLNIREIPGTGTYELYSDRIFIDKHTSNVIDKIPITHQTIQTYLVNSIRCNGKETPYSFVTATTFPWSSDHVKDDGITVNNWLAKDLSLHLNDSVTLYYYVIGPLFTLKEKSNRFIVAHIIDINSYSADRTLMPFIPGFSDAGSCRDWNPGVPIVIKKIRKKDEKYWNEFRGTPKAFIPKETGLKLWSTPFGYYTAIRFDKKEISSADSLKILILKQIKIKDYGINIIPVRKEGISSALNSIDFGELFLYLSFFIIIAAVMLTALSYSLNTESRVQESAILSGLGFTKRRIVHLRLAESLTVVIVGGIIGSLIGILYNDLLIYGLNSVWHEAIGERMVHVHVLPSALVIGASSGMLIALLTIYWVTLHKLKQPLASLIKGVFNDGKIISNNYPSLFIGLISFIFSIGLVFISVNTKSYNNAGMFLSAGGLFLLGTTCLIWYCLSIQRFNGSRSMSLLMLALKNAGRNKNRSLATIFILALGTFIIVLTGSYRKTYYGDENIKKSGTGGFLIWAETAIPLTFNLNTPEGRKNLLTEKENDLDSVHFAQLHCLSGDDASCLNLNQVTHPGIIGINPVDFDNRGAFSFVTLLDHKYKDHPWQILRETSDKKIIPAFADQTVIQYGLKKIVGDTISYVDEYGETTKFRLAGGLDNSIFQGKLLISDSVFATHFPSMGSKVILIDAPKSKQNLILNVINSSLSEFGVNTTPASVRLAGFNSVENTYLSVFMVLGGLGLLIGTLGLGMILYRNMLDRRHELALLKALGYNTKQVLQIVISENVFLLLAGLFCGLTSAIIGIFPSLISPSFSIQGEFLVLLITLVFLLGVLWIYFLTKSIIKSNLLVSLRDE